MSTTSKAYFTAEELLRLTDTTNLVVVVIGNMESNMRVFGPFDSLLAALEVGQKLTQTNTYRFTVRELQMAVEVRGADQ